MAGRVVRISIAPVKALHLANPEEVELAPAGVEGDRRFWLVDARGRLFNDKRRPELLRVRAEWDEATRRLGLEFPDGRRVEGIVEPGEPVEATLYGQPHLSRAVPGLWQQALSDYAGEPLTLLWSERGAVDRGVGGGAVTVVSCGSLERLREEASIAPSTGAASECCSRSTASRRTRRTSGSAAAWRSATPSSLRSATWADAP